MIGRLPFLRPKESYLTCRGRDDGGGAQIMACASTMIAARLLGIRYAHSPLTTVAHAPAGTDPAAWAEHWESFFHLGCDEIQAADLEAQGLAVAAVPKPHRFRPRSRRLQVVAHCHKLTDKHPGQWAALAPELRKKYFSTPKPDLPTDPPGSIRIGIHVRRGDVGSTGRFSERYTADEEILGRVRRLRDALATAGRPVVLSLFSEGNPDDFAAFRREGVVLHLDEDAFLTFHHLVRSHVIVLAKSTFSWLAGLIGGGLCLYEPFWHPPLPGWLDFATVDSLPESRLADAAMQAAANTPDTTRTT